jgi:isoleucyl-tRNA synthetase
LKTRQPIGALRVKLPASARGALSTDGAMAEQLTAELLDELNAKALELIPDEAEMVERTLYPLLPILGPRRGAAVGAIMSAARAGEWQALDDGRVIVAGLTLEPDEFRLTARARQGHEVAEEGDLLVALDTRLTPELEAEGLAREIAHRLQGLRKAAGYDIADRVVVMVAGDAAILAQIEPHRAWLADEVLATELQLDPTADLADADRSETLELGGATLKLMLRRAV